MPSLFQSARALAAGAARGALGQLSELQKAQGAAVATPQSRAVEPKSMLDDPYAGLMQQGYKKRDSAITHQMLRRMVRDTPVVNAILRTRINQLANFAKPQPNKYELGFKIKMKDAKDSPSKAEQKRIHEIEQFVVQCGVPEHARHRDNFSRWIKKVGRDTLTMGHDATEIVNDRKNAPCEFLAVDAATISLAEVDPEESRKSPDKVVRYVQTYMDQVCAEYTWDEMMFGIRLPATDLALQGYGECELENLTEVVSNLLNISSYNGNFFSNNSLPRGVINMRGEVNEAMLDGFRRHWYSMLSGVENSFVTPIANARDGLEFIGMQQNNVDMQMENWHSIMVRCATAVFSISPEEIGFGMGPMGQTSSLSTPTNVDKVVEGRERGLVPLLNHFAHNINTHIIDRLDPDFYIDFVGLSGLTQDQQTQLSATQVSTFRTVNEVRAEGDLPPLPKEQGDIILNAIWLQNQSMLQQADQQAQQAQQGQAGFGDDGQGGAQGQGDGPGPQEEQQGPPQGDDGAQQDPNGPIDQPAQEAMQRSLTAPARLNLLGMTPLDESATNFWGDL